MANCFCWRRELEAGTLQDRDTLRMWDQGERGGKRERQTDREVYTICVCGYVGEEGDAGEALA